MDRPEGLEPPTLRFEAGRSIPLSYGRKMVWVRGFEPLASRFQGENSTGLSYTQIEGRSETTFTCVWWWGAVAVVCVSFAWRTVASAERESQWCRG